MAMVIIYPPRESTITDTHPLTHSLQYHFLLCVCVCVCVTCECECVTHPLTHSLTHSNITFCCVCVCVYVTCECECVLPSSLLASAMLLRCCTAALATSATRSTINEPSVSVCVSERERA